MQQVLETFFLSKRHRIPTKDARSHPFIIRRCKRLFCGKRHKIPLQSLPQSCRKLVIKLLLRYASQIEIEAVHLYVVSFIVILGEKLLQYIRDTAATESVPVRIEIPGELFVRHPEPERYFVNHCHLYILMLPVSVIFPYRGQRRNHPARKRRPFQ